MLKIIRGTLVITLLFLNTLILSIVFVCLASIQSIMPLQKLKEYFYNLTEETYHLWVDVNAITLKSTLPTRWSLEFDNSLDKKDWYALVANHVSGIDILALQILFNRKVPHLKFFMKDSLKWLPIIGQFCYFFNYPFIKRYTPKQIKKNPARKKQNILNLKKTCQKIKNQPTTVINFIEGTRFTTAKHKMQKSPYKNLLQPLAGGTSVLLTELSKEISVIIDATITYEGGKTLVDLLLGKVDLVKVRARVINIDSSWHGDFYHDPKYKRDITNKIKTIWQEKDQVIA